MESRQKFIIEARYTNLKSISPPAPAWSKATLNTGGVGMSGADPHCETETIFYVHAMALRMGPSIKY